GEEHPLTAVSANNLATLLHATGDLPRARHLLRRASAVPARWPGQRSPPHAAVPNNAGMPAPAHGGYAPARRAPKHAGEIPPPPPRCTTARSSGSPSNATPTPRRTSWAAWTSAAIT